jgi:hypothetical protein
MGEGGYVGEFYEYDFNEVVGYPGEKVSLRHVGREVLPEGRLMRNRSSVDVHEQIPLESFSISLNVVSDRAEEIATINQFMLDLHTRTIQGLGNRTSLPLICEVAGYVGERRRMSGYSVQLMRNAFVCARPIRGLSGTG